MSHGIISGILTASLIVMFLGIWAWAWSKNNKSAFEKMSHLPLEENTSQNPPKNNKESAA